MFTWARTNTAYAIGASALTAGDFAVGKSTYIGLGDVAASTAGVNGFVGATVLGAAANGGLATNVIAAQTASATP